MPRSTAPASCSTSGAPLYGPDSVRPVGITDGEYQNRARLNQLWKAYLEERPRYAAWIESLPAAEQAAYDSATAEIQEGAERVLVLLNAVPYPGELWATGGFGTGSSFFPSAYNVTDRDPEVTSACASRCVDGAQRHVVQAGGKGCDVKWEYNCFYLERPPYSRRKNLRYRDFGCADWQLELDKAWATLEAGIAKVDAIYGAALYIDPRSGLSGAELAGAVRDYNQTRQTSAETALEWPGLGPGGTDLETWIALGIAAVFLAVVVR